MLLARTVDVTLIFTVPARTPDRRRGTERPQPEIRRAVRPSDSTLDCTTMMVGQGGVSRGTWPQRAKGVPIG